MSVSYATISKTGCCNRCADCPRAYQEPIILYGASYAGSVVGLVPYIDGVGCERKRVYAVYVRRMRSADYGSRLPRVAACCFEDIFPTEKDITTTFSAWHYLGLTCAYRQHVLHCLTGTYCDSTNFKIGSFRYVYRIFMSEFL